MPNSYIVGSSDKRPWGSWLCTDVGQNYAVKTITVDPKQKLSLQRHQHRAEHWVIVAGQATVTIDETTLVLNANQSVFIPAGAKHRMENAGSSVLVFVEVQYGSVLSEDDIERFDDQYGRA